MIDLQEFNNCICKQRSVPHRLCDGPASFEENGVKVKFTAKSDEEVVALVFDDCICKDIRPKCDGLFLFRRNNLKFICLAELKGSDVNHAFKQLFYTKTERLEYQRIKHLFIEKSECRIQEKAFIISNHIVPRHEQQKLEDSFGFRITAILHSTATTPIPDLRDYVIQ